MVFCKEILLLCWLVFHCCLPKAGIVTWSRPHKKNWRKERSMGFFYLPFAGKWDGCFQVITSCSITKLCKVFASLRLTAVNWLLEWETEGTRVIGSPEFESFLLHWLDLSCCDPKMISWIMLVNSQLVTSYQFVFLILIIFGCIRLKLSGWLARKQGRST